MKTINMLILGAVLLLASAASYAAEPFMTAENEVGGTITLFKDEVPEMIQDRVAACIGARMATSTSPLDGKDIFGCWVPTIKTIQIYWILSRNVRDYPLHQWELAKPKAKPQRQQYKGM